MTELSYKARWTLGIIIFFIILVIINASVLVTAYKHRPEKATENAYDQGMLFEEVLQKRKTFSKLGLKANFIMDCQSQCQMLVLIQGSVDKYTWSNTLQLDLKKTNSASKDFQLTMQLTEPGKYRAELPTVLSGLWILTANLVVDSQEVEITDNVKFL